MHVDVYGGVFTMNLYQNPAHEEQSKILFPPPGYRESRLQKACFHLLKTQPDKSIKSGIPISQKVSFLVFLTITCALFILGQFSINDIMVVFSIFLLLQVIFRFYAAKISIFNSPKTKSTSPSKKSVSFALPKFTLLIPLYHEQAVASRSVSAMEALNYPADKLEVFYLTEEDDKATESALKKAIKHQNFKIISVPKHAPRTKPKALNYGLQFSTGDIVTVYDAEDIPHPQQLFAAAQAFQNGGTNLAVIQAPLHAYNGEESWIASQFDLEYAIHFDVWLPAMTKMGWPIPLGGTSNHFKKNVLEKVGAWDPFNVTEDADLGYRLALNGYSAGMIELPTREEAPINLAQWLPQRTRWIKGHIQSLAVLSRKPFETIKSLGLWRSLGCLITFVSAILTAGLHGPLLLYLAYSIITAPNTLNPLHLIPIILAFSSVILAALASSAVTRCFKPLLTAPFYWPLMSFAFIRAIWELHTRPYIWSKTQHGISKSKIPLLHKEPVT